MEAGNARFATLSQDVLSCIAAFLVVAEAAAVAPVAKSVQLLAASFWDLPLRRAPESCSHSSASSREASLERGWPAEEY